MNIDRRLFLGLVAGAMCSKSVPLYASVKKSTENPVADLLIEKYLKIKKFRLEIGASKPFKVLHCSDTHLSLSNVGDMLRGDSKSIRLFEDRHRRFPHCIQSLAASISYAGKMKMPFFHTGDLFDFYGEANLDYVKDAFTGVDWFASVGNHETYGHHSSGMNPHTHPQAESVRRKIEMVWANPILVSSRVINGINFVAFDNGGLECWSRDRQFELIKAEFERGMPVVLLCHIPFYTEELYELMRRNEIATWSYYSKDWHVAPGKMEGYLMIDEVVRGSQPRSYSRKLLGFFRRQKNLKAILNGHLHFTNLGEWSGVPQLVAGGNYCGDACEVEFC